VIRSIRAPRVVGRAEMTLEFREVDLRDGATHRITADALVIEGRSGTKGDVGKVIGSTIGGAVVGGILGGGKGAVKGGAVGAGAGTVWAVATRGPDIVLEPGRELHATLARPMQVTVTGPAGPNP
jgi:hypothetical protein